MTIEKFLSRLFYRLKKHLKLVFISIFFFISISLIFNIFSILKHQEETKSSENFYNNIIFGEDNELKDVCLDVSNSLHNGKFLENLPKETGVFFSFIHNFCQLKKQQSSSVLKGKNLDFLSLTSNICNFQSLDKTQMGAWGLKEFISSNDNIFFSGISLFFLLFN